MATHPPLYLYLYLYNDKYNDKYNDEYNDEYNDDNDSASSFCLLGTICLRTSDHLPASEEFTLHNVKGAQCTSDMYTVHIVNAQCQVCTMHNTHLICAVYIVHNTL